MVKASTLCNLTPCCLPPSLSIPTLCCCYNMFHTIHYYSQWKHNGYFYWHISRLSKYFDTTLYDAMFHSCHKLFHIICWDNVQFHTSNITCSAVIQVLPCSLGKLSSSMQCDFSMPPLLLYWMQSSSKVQDARIKCRMYFHFLFYWLTMKIRHVN